MNDHKFCFRSEEDFHKYLLSVVDQVYLMSRHGESLAGIKKLIIDATVSVTRIVGGADAV